jgi:hypothetical protein
MKINLLTKLLFALAFVPTFSNAQGTMIFDQQSSDESNGGTAGNIIQDWQPTGQSFTPSLAGVSFVRLQLFDANRNNGTGVTIYVNLRSGSITGSIVDSTAPVALPDNFGLPLSAGYVTFLFPNTVPVQPGATYFFEPVVQSGDPWAVVGGSFNYPGGDEYLRGSAFPSDYWFREGIIVPEPSISVLLILAAGLCVQSRRSRRHAVQFCYARSSHNSERKQGGSV